MRLRHEPFGHSGYGFWAGTIYPTSGTLEVWFQHLKPYTPFDDESVRREFRDRLNRAPGVEVAEAKIALRPSIRLSVFADEAAAEALTKAFAWLPAIARERLGSGTTPGDQPTP